MKSTLKTLPFNRPFIDEGVLNYIRKVLDAGTLSGNGTSCRTVEHRLQDLYGIRHVLLTSSGTHALEMAMMLLNMRPGDEVILPSFTFVSTASAIIRAGGKPVFCEINEDTFTLDVHDFEHRISRRTRAVVPVHYAGVAADMNEISQIARSHRLLVIEDAAQGVNARYRGKYLGGIGDMGIFSFHDTKNYVCGEGGAFTTQDSSLARRAEIIREKGTNRANFLRGEVDKYTWVDVGSSFVLSEILAAVLEYQLGNRKKIQARRRAIFLKYVEGLADLERQEKLRLPRIPKYCQTNYHIFAVLFANERRRNWVIKKLQSSGIEARFHYVPLHSSPYAVKTLGLDKISLPITDRVAGSILRLPLYPQLTDDQVSRVIDTLGVILR